MCTELRHNKTVVVKMVMENEIDDEHDDDDGRGLLISLFIFKMHKCCHSLQPPKYRTIKRKE